MNICDCEHPVRVWNEALREFLFVPCRKCNTCRKKHASKWVVRLENERSMHQYCFFVTLTYDEYYLPRLHRNHDDPDELIDWRNDNISISVKNDLVFNAPSDYLYFDKCLEKFGIPYANFNHIQLFHKRLNKKFYEKISEYKNFRYFLVSEYGSTTFRPHFHGIYYVDKKSVAENFAESIRSCWHYGRCDIQPVESSACSYVSQYLNCISDLPSFYANREIRPKFVCSKFPSIGAFDECPENDAKIFFDGSSTKVVTRKDSSSPKVVPLLPCVENKLFPKFIFFKQISDSLRIRVLKSVVRLCPKEFDSLVPSVLSFVEFKSYVLSMSLRRQENSHVTSELVTYFSNLCRYLSADQLVSRLKRLYYVLVRIVRNAVNFGVSLEYYMQKIIDYYDKKEYQLLKHFYSFQSDYVRRFNSEDLVYCYPDYCYQFNKESWKDLSALGFSKLSDVKDYDLMCKESASVMEVNTKTHRKNAYLEKLAVNNRILFNLISFYYAKKRNEVAKACA